MEIRKAQRKAVKIKLAITGPSGSGKTMGALLVAAGLVDGGKILVIDTEDGGADLYADHPILNGLTYDVIEIKAPYTIQKYVAALDAATNAKYDCVIVDSISHAWAGEGGLLDKKSSIDSRGGNSYTNWGPIKKEQNLFVSKIVHADYHLIATMRSKQDYVMETNDKGKQQPKKVGLAPVQNDGIEYEFTTVFDVGIDHQYQCSKDRTGLFDGMIEKLSFQTGSTIRKWMSGKEIKEGEMTPIGEKRAQELRELIARSGSTEENLKQYSEKLLGGSFGGLENMPLYVYHQITPILYKKIQKAEKCQEA